MKKKRSKNLCSTAFMCGVWWSAVAEEEGEGLTPRGNGANTCCKRGERGRGESEK